MLLFGVIFLEIDFVLLVVLLRPALPFFLLIAGPGRASARKGPGELALGGQRKTSEELLFASEQEVIVIQVLIFHAPLDLQSICFA